MQATAVGMNGEVSTAIADWSAVVAFPRSLHTSGDYVNEASVIGTGPTAADPGTRTAGTRSCSRIRPPNPAW